FKTVEKINDALGRRGNLAADGRPILGLDAEEVARIVFDIDENCMIVPAHIWTPWFSLFGSMSGFDRIEDCFEKQTAKIFAVETGLSSDPAMNWRLSALDRFTLISNSDSHSPAKIGREANVFNCDLDYKTIRGVLKTKDKKRFLYTVEFFPEEGKYHYDGHRLCNVVFSPEESKKNNNVCPKCKKPLTIGVMNRVSRLADRTEGFVPDNAIPFKSLVPLSEIIAESKGLKAASIASEKEYFSAVAKFGTEFNILLHAPREALAKGLSPKLAEGVMRMREGKVSAAAGYDGEYGRISVFGKDDDAKPSVEQQLSLF
ncbi:MAG: endonuclease Q family protein, partial [Candidatus Methanoperedens sp.]